MGRKPPPLACVNDCVEERRNATKQAVLLLNRGHQAQSSTNPKLHMPHPSPYRHTPHPAHGSPSPPAPPRPHPSLCIIRPAPPKHTMDVSKRCSKIVCRLSLCSDKETARCEEGQIPTPSYQSSTVCATCVCLTGSITGSGSGVVEPAGKAMALKNLGQGVRNHVPP